jgi:chemotaxis protein CheD
MEYIVGIGEYAISANSNDVIKTFSLGTCVGLVVYSKSKKVMGLAHIALPDSNINLEDSEGCPARYADKAVDLLVNEMKYRYACSSYDLEVAIIGGFDGKMNDNFKIGERNIEVVTEKLKKMGIRCNSIETGGNKSRTVTAYVETGEVEILSYQME